MKFSHIFFVFGILLCLSSCSKDNYEPYKPTEWQYDKYSDSSILPGDDFYRFVCGKGIATEGSDSWTPFYCWDKLEIDFLERASREGEDNPVPVLKRIFELKAATVSGEQEHIAKAFARMRARLDDIEKRTEGWEFPEKAAEYCLSGYSPFSVCPKNLYGHKLGFYTVPHYEDMLKDWTEEQLKMAGIKDKYNEMLPKARMFEKYLSDNITKDEESIQNLDAGIPEECRRLKDYVGTFAGTKAGNSTLERFAAALGNQNPDFVPVDDEAKQYFELVDNMQEAWMKEAADAFLWCAAVSYDMNFILDAEVMVQDLFFITTQFPNLFMNMSHAFCDMYAKPEHEKRNREIFEALRNTMVERLEQSEWMTPYTKTGARKKIDAMECHTGILDWSRYEADMPVSDDLCSALHEVGRSNISKLMAISGDNDNLDHIIASIYVAPLVGMPAYSANLFYIPSANAMCILPSTFVLVDMNPEFPFLTYFIGHEMCHGFDADGFNYNERGELGDWWSIDDRLVFKNKQNQLISIFNQYYVGETTFCNGTQTIAEDMADLGGFEIAYYTAVKELEQKFRGEELLEKKRQFFKSYAILYAKYSSPKGKINQAKEDVHSINDYRVNGIVNNIDDWYQLFDVTPDSKYYLAPERRVYLW